METGQKGSAVTQAAKELVSSHDASTQDVARLLNNDADGLPFEGEILSRPCHQGHQMDACDSNRMPLR